MLVRETTAMRAAAAVSSRRRPLAVRAARTQDVVSSTTTSRDNKNRQNTSGAGAGVVQKFLSRQHLAKDFTKQLKISESYWNGMKRGGGGQGKAKTVVEQMPTTAPTALHGLVDYDVCVCGGNLGIAIALALQKRGYRVLIIERRWRWRSVLECFMATNGLLQFHSLQPGVAFELNCRGEPPVPGFRSMIEVCIH